MRVDNQEMPGNFGIRVIGTMPTNTRDVFTVQKNNLETEFKCDYRSQEVPAMMEAPDLNDYMTDEESEGDTPEFDVKIPSFSDLVSGFEEGDEQILLHKEQQQSYVKELEIRGFDPEPRYDIVSVQKERMALLNRNISMQRQQQTALMPGFIEDLNEEVQFNANKMYLV